MIGQRVNNYEILAQIGEGGMGTVYLARHPVIDRKAAVKVLRGTMANDPGLVNRFFNEARAANAIHHPNIIDVLDVGMMGHPPTPYLMMEYLEGESLAQRLKRMGRIHTGDAVEFTYQTAAALAAAHGKGIVHRDLKPENLFLVPDPNVPGREQIKVLDFGIAKLRGDLSPDAVKTQTGALMGTPPYMSPEQCRGISDDVDHRTDIYALGIILYEMLCGAPPFTDPGFGNVLVMHLTLAPTPPRTINPGIPPHIEKVILRALAKAPAERFTSMVELQAALGTGPAHTIAGAARAVDPVGATPAAPRPPTTFSATAGEVERLRKGQRRPLRLALAAGVALLAGVAIFVAAKGGPAPKESTVAPAPAAAVAAPPTANAAPPPPVAVAAIPSPGPADAGVPPDAGDAGRKSKGRGQKKTKSDGVEKW